MDLQKIQNTAPKIPELVMQSLLTAMETGQIKVQDELPPERDLAATLGVGRGSLRECLAILEYLNVIETRGNRKIVLKDSSYFRKAVSFVKLSSHIITVEDLIEFRRTIEVEIVRLACQRATEADLDALNEIMIRLKKDLRDFVGDAEFHASLAKASHNAYFASTMELLSCIIADLRVRYYKLPKYYERTYESHLRIYEAVKRRDEAAAMDEMSKHCDLVLDFIRESADLDLDQEDGE